MSRLGMPLGQYRPHRPSMTVGQQVTPYSAPPVIQPQPNPVVQAIQAGPQPGAYTPPVGGPPQASARPAPSVQQQTAAFGPSVTSGGVSGSIAPAPISPTSGMTSVWVPGNATREGGYRLLTPAQLAAGDVFAGTPTSFDMGQRLQQTGGIYNQGWVQHPSGVMELHMPSGYVSPDRLGAAGSATVVPNAPQMLNWGAPGIRGNPLLDALLAGSARDGGGPSASSAK